MQSSPATFRSISEPKRYRSHSFTPGGNAGIFRNQINNRGDNKDLAKLNIYGIQTLSLLAKLKLFCFFLFPLPFSFIYEVYFRFLL